jgi:hypothetical protein
MITFFDDACFTRSATGGFGCYSDVFNVPTCAPGAPLARCALGVGSGQHGGWLQGGRKAAARGAHTSAVGHGKLVERGRVSLVVGGGGEGCAERVEAWEDLLLMLERAGADCWPVRFTNSRDRGRFRVTTTGTDRHRHRGPR